MKSQPQNPEFRNIHENFHPCVVGTQKNHLIETFILSTKTHVKTDGLRK